MGNTNVAVRACPSGWSAVVVELASGAAAAELFGPVVTPAMAAADPPLARLALGAEVGSNNTGELSGAVEALLWAAEYLRGRTVEIRYDSEYAYKVLWGGL